MGAAAVALFIVLLGGASARAAELVYWENDPQQGQIAVVDLGSGVAGLLNTTGSEVSSPEGLSYDPVANRLYTASGNDRISYVNLDGSGGGALPVPATTRIDDPRGVVVDPAARIAYWLNTPFMQPETISWARLDGSEGGTLPLRGQPLLGTQRLTVDPAGGRLFWGNSDGSIHYAPLVGSVGVAGELAVKSNGAGANLLGISLGTGLGEIFWVEFGADAVWSAGLDGTAKQEVVSGPSAAVNQPSGLAFDPTQNRLYWANSGVEGSAQGALGSAVLGAGAVEMTPIGVAVNHPQDLVVIKSPAAFTRPQVTLSSGQLQCSPGGWVPDFAASFVYQSPRSFSYRWTLNGDPIAAATEPSYPPSTSGSYACAVTATNQAGDSTQTSGTQVVKVISTSRGGKTVIRRSGGPADLQLLGKARHLKARPGELLTLKLRTSNQGDAPSLPGKLCLKLTKGAKRALRAGRCRRLGALAGGTTEAARLRLRVKRSANPGVYRLRIAAPGDQVKVTVRVLR